MIHSWNLWIPCRCKKSKIYSNIFLSLNNTYITVRQNRHTTTPTTQTPKGLYWWSMLPIPNTCRGVVCHCSKVTTSTACPSSVTVFSMRVATGAMATCMGRFPWARLVTTVWYMLTGIWTRPAGVERRRGGGVEPTFPGTWEWLVLPDMGGKFDKVKERLLAGSSLFLFSIVVSIPTISFHSKRPETI